MSRVISIVSDDVVPVRGYLAMDSVVNGRCYGGVRIAPDLSAELMARLARTMTLKHGFVGLPLGGAKAGIIADPEMPIEAKRQLLKGFGGAIRPFLQTRSYLPASDLGTSSEDIKYMLGAIGLSSDRGRHRGLSHQTTGFYSGISVFAAAVAAARLIGLDLKRLSVAVEGFGSVGSSAARIFWERGIRLVAISTSLGAVYNEAGLDIGELIKLREQAGNQVVNQFDRGEKIDKGRLAGLPVDIFCPCAQSYSITEANVGGVAARIISPGANVPTTAEAESVLLRKQIFLIPDFVANCGGVLGIFMKRTGLKEAHIRQFIEDKLGEQLTWLTEASRREGLPLRAYAERVSRARFLKAKAAVEGRSAGSRVFRFALKLYRRGVIPQRLVTPFASRFVKRKVME